MNPIVKWPGGKGRELRQIEELIPQFDRYIEPFFGGGAMFFHLEPERAAINDISAQLMDFYRLVQAQDGELRSCLWNYEDSFRETMTACRDRMSELTAMFEQLCTGTLDREACLAGLAPIASYVSGAANARGGRQLIPDRGAFEDDLLHFAWDKLRRTAANSKARPFSQEDLEENLLTGFASGYYMYFRRVFNDQALGQAQLTPGQAMANFYFIRTYCYGSMFRYNARGEFNVPYGGMSYNRKPMAPKLETMFSPEMARLMTGTRIESRDFEGFLEDCHLTEGDFLFLDPPYDSDFSDYEGNAFTRADQARLAKLLRGTPARFILVIKNTAYIRDLYAGVHRVLQFETQYAYNVRSRNDRVAEHLIITNIPPEENGMFF